MKGSKHILLVEDNPKDIELTLNALEECNLTDEVVIAHDGAEALEHLFHRESFSKSPAENPVVILLDLNMPKLGGIQVLEKIKSDEKMKFIPVIIFTSSRKPSDLEKCYKLGVNAYVVKPVHFTQYKETIKQIGIFWALINEPPPSSIGR